MEKISLTFKDQYVENEFKNSQSRIHQKGFLFLTVALVLQSSAMFFSNPLELNIYETKITVLFLLGLAFIIFGYILIRKKFPNHSNKGILLYVFSFTICGSEFVHILQDSMNLSAWVYFLLGVNIQTGCLFLLISQVRWTHSLILITTAHIYSWFRVIDIVNTTGAQKTAFISLGIHILLLFTLTYTCEKELRQSFQKIRADNQQLCSFEEIIKSVMASAVIIMKDDDIMFMNDATKKLLDVKDKSDLHGVLHTIEIVSQDEKKMLRPNFLFDEKYKTTRQNFSNLYKQYKSLEDQTRSLKIYEKYDKGFKNMEGEVRALSEEKKTFSIQVGVTFWLGAKSIIIIMNDVSSIKNQFRSLDSYKDNLLATVSHDLRTPLNGILGTLEILYEEIEEEKSKEKLQITIISAKLLMNMINDFLDFSLISKGRLRLKFETSNIRALVEETTSIMALQAKLKGLRLIVENHLTGCENYLVDNNRLRQVLLNLIGNAVKFTSKGQVTVRIYEENVQEKINLPCQRNSTVVEKNQELDQDEIKEVWVNTAKERNSTDQNDPGFPSINFDIKRLIFEVEDTGIGIKPEDIDKLFKLFSRATSGNDQNMNGAGLGLAISQSLVILMNSNESGGIIKVTSELGKGSKFWFPIFLDNEPSEMFKEVQDNSMQYPFSSSPKLQNLNDISPRTRIYSENEFLITNKPRPKMILIVDDDQINLLVATNYLKSLQNEFIIFTSGNGQDALDKVVSFAQENYFFDIILMDCNMPIMDGYEATQRIKKMMKDKILPWAPIIAITANITSTDKEKCFQSGMDLFLTKPYTKAQLIKILEEAECIRSKYNISL